MSEMIFHASIDAAEPLRVAEFLAALWDGTVAPFPPIARGSWIVMAGDDRGSAIEIYPLGTELVEVPGDADAGSVNRPGMHGSATHLAIATDMTREAVIALAGADGWTAKYRSRGGLFGVIEVWVEDRVMIEVLTPEMQAQYLAQFTPEGWNDALIAA
jgi:hypothetical protein